MAASSLFLLALLAPSALAAPSAALPAGAAPLLLRAAHLLHARESVITEYADGNTTVTDSGTGLIISQAPATDGGGHGFDVSAVVWLACAFAAGAPLLLAGLKLGRLTTALSLGCLVTALVWTALVNTLSAPGIADVFVLAIALAAFALGFLPGLLRPLRAAGLCALGIGGGASLGVRLVLLRPGLLVGVFGGNWGIIAVCAALGLLGVVVRQRAGVALASASAGSFLVALGIDLVLNKQAGMSSGLRLLFDRNSAHVLYIFDHPYAPTASTYALLGASLALAPLFAYAQHRLFPGPFYARPARKSFMLTDDDLSAPLRPSAESVLDEKSPGAAHSPRFENGGESVPSSPTVGTKRGTLVRADSESTLGKGPAIYVHEVGKAKG